MKETDGRLTARGIWEGLGISQIWRIDLCDGRSFTWDVTMDVTQAREIKQQRLCCFFSEAYKQFFSDHAEAKLGDSYYDAEIDLLQRCIPAGRVGLQGADNTLPPVFLSFSQDSGNFVKVFNSDRSLKARILHLERVEPEDGTMFAPGHYACFNARFSVGADEGINRDNFDNSLEDGNFRFVFDRGSGRLYGKTGDEITKNIALYTSLRAGGRWHDSSSSALWKITHRSGNLIKAFGTWLDLPVSQEWEFLIKEQGQIRWNAVMRVDKEITVDRIQANIMFSERFSQWMGGGNEGVFSAFPPDIDGDWDCIWSAAPDTGSIGLKEDPALHLPKITLAPVQVNPGWCLKIINSDRYHRGRVLQYSGSKELTFAPGSYPYFSGIVTIHTT